VKKRRFGFSSDVQGLDTERILRVLASHGVDYVLIGGLAALAHGSTIATADADVLPRLDAVNLERLLDALEELGAAVLISERRQAMEAGDPWEVVELNERGTEALPSADAWHFTTEAGPIDVVVKVSGVGSYDAHVPAAQERVAFGVGIRVAGLSDLIASKEATGRPKDEAILRELRELRDQGST
jgi:hypothetical protein